MQVDADAGVFVPDVGIDGTGTEYIAYGIGVGMGRTTNRVGHTVAALRQTDDIGSEDASGVQGCVESVWWKWTAVRGLKSGMALVPSVAIGVKINVLGEKNRVNPGLTPIHFSWRDI